MAGKSVIEVVEREKGKINPRYALKISQAYEIRENGEGLPLECIAVGFKYGYIQGMKAAHAEMKRKAI